MLGVSGNIFILPPTILLALPKTLLEGTVARVFLLLEIFLKTKILFIFGTGTVFYTKKSRDKVSFRNFLMNCKQLKVETIFL